MSTYSDKIEKLFKKCFPSYRLTKEKYVFYQNTRLLFDFFIPEMRLLIEVQGQQHYSFNSFFHKDKKDLDNQKFHDVLKEDWAASNGYSLLCLKYDIIDELTESSFRSLLIKNIYR